MNWAAGIPPAAPAGKELDETDPVTPSAPDPAEELAVVIVVVVAAPAAVPAPGAPVRPTPPAYRIPEELQPAVRGVGTPMVDSKGMWVVSRGAVVLKVLGVMEDGVGIFRVTPAMPLPIP